ncbi:GTPase domain-containing protein [Limnoglobus roseus]|uniref:G domain-containing protein n=1 Tax=Limnoglobus roseus TaxID=2598579 RepID=A0A5C1ALJ0_9BACT|nr:GTPase domain-containing protein [Limnoglobus roseus]QEL18054.1 hypothetical protein PX52LOC_05068 [Limnoglobus roseus]
MTEPDSPRTRLAQLVADYDWLEEHCRKQPDLARHAGHLRLAAALTRNVVSGAIERQPVPPLHIAVVGGAGSGKSTVSNFLAGGVVAEANPQAGYTRHPTAYVSAAQTLAWPSYLGFLGPLRKITEKSPSNRDEDVYQIHRVSPSEAADPLTDFVIWDCPDMTTWASQGYVTRLIEVSALADVIVYVASDERYNDKVPTQFLQMLVEAGKAVVVVLTKMKEADAPSLVAHFRQEVLPRINGQAEIPPIPVVVIPFLNEAERTDPGKAGAKYRVPLLNQILALCPSPKEVRERTVRNAVKYLETSAAGLLEVARKDLTELEAWSATVAGGRRTFEERYRKEYLVGEPFRRFDRTRQQLIDMLRLPGPARYADQAFAILRTPFTYARDFVVKLGGPVEVPNLPEQTVLTNAMTGWIEAIQAESLRRTGTHSIWKEVARSFDSGLKQQAMDRFQVVARQFELKEGDELEQAGRSLTESLQAHPGTLGALRFGMLGVDVAAVVTALWLTWPPEWYHLLLLPVAAAVGHTAAELAIRLRVDAARSSARAKREALLSEVVTKPMARWLEDLPASGGSSVERLQLALRRVPEAVRELAALTTATPPANPA